MDPSHQSPTPTGRGLVREVAAVYCAQLLLVIGIVHGGAALGLTGWVHELVALVFLLLPVLVLDRRGRPYERYGFHADRPLGDLALAAVTMAIAFVPIALIAPTVWGLGDVPWRFRWPAGYPGVMVAHLVVVALPEEVFYRGYLLGRLDDIFPARLRVLGAELGWGWPLQAALFALGHYLIDLSPARLAVFFPALAFGWLRARRGGLLAPVLFHAASNIFMDLLRGGLGLG